MLPLLRVKSLKNAFRSISLFEIKHSSQLVSTLPPNLKVSDLKIFDDVPAPKLKPVDYYFPALNFNGSLEVLSFNGDPIPEEEKLFKLDARIFNVAIRKDIVLECIRYTRHKRRQPKKTKRKSEIRGSNKKPWAQKGLGRAQVGHKRNSVWRGGQKAHGPVIRDYSIGLNRKMRAKGMMIALAAKFREGNLFVFDNFQSNVRHSNYVLSQYSHILCYFVST